ncbi:MAG: flippase-like domain-containing protein, partial [Actinobacteria bacterium]
PNSPLRRRDVTSATMIGVLMSATLPARLGEPARAMVLARRTGRMRFTFPVLLGTLVSQTVLNIAALALLGVIIVASTDLFHSGSTKLFVFSLVPLVLLLVVILAPVVVRRPMGTGRLARISEAIRAALLRVRKGLSVFRDPRYGSLATAAQLGAWGVQLSACAVLFEALGMHGVGIGAAAAVLFAVNVTAVVPATPSNIGVFADDRVRRGSSRRPRLRRDPAGRRGCDSGRPGAPRTRSRGPHVVRHAPARPERGTGPALPAGAEGWPGDRDHLAATRQLT